MIAYLLLWPALLLLATYESHEAIVFGRWSRRMFLTIAALGSVVLVATLLIIRPRITAPFTRWINRHRWVRLFGLICPITGWLFAVVAAVLMQPSHELSICLTWSLISLLGTVIAFDVSLLLVGRDEAARRTILMRTLAVGISVMLAVGLVEITGRILNLEPPDQLQINPPDLDLQWQTDEFDTRVTTNSQGLREPQDIGEKTEGVYRVMVVGDSMTFGQGVNDDEVYPRVAQSLLRTKHNRKNIEIINVSRRGAGPGEYLQYVRHFGKRFRPDLIVIAYYTGNDTPVRQPYVPRTKEQLDRLKADILAESKTHFLLKTFVGRLIERRIFRRIRTWRTRLVADNLQGQPDPIFGTPNVINDVIPPDKLPPAARRRFEKLQSAGWIDKATAGRVSPGLIEAAVRRPTAIVDMMSLRDETRDAMQREWQLTVSILDATIACAESLNSKVVLLVLPHPYQIDPQAVGSLRKLGYETHPKMLGHRLQNDRVVEYCKIRELTCLDPFGDFRKRIADGERLYFPLDSHLTPAGHRVLAEMLAEWLAAKSQGSQ